MRAIAHRPSQVVDRIRLALADHGRPTTGARVLLVGVAYKPNVEDVRDSPALDILRRLEDCGATVAYFDPLVPTVRLAERTALQGVQDPRTIEADIVVVHTVHADMDLSWLSAHPLVLDATYQLTTAPHAIRL
jgi:UDP-N-acetyl-D-mannosaminuronate dehydrogenase